MFAQELGPARIIVNKHSMKLKAENTNTHTEAHTHSSVLKCVWEKNVVDRIGPKISQIEANIRLHFAGMTPK